MATVSLEEKRLKALKQQLFGKESSSPKSASKKSAVHIQTPTISRIETTAIDPSSLKTDLLKITLLSFLALAIQFALFFANQNGLIKLFR